MKELKSQTSHPSHTPISFSIHLSFSDHSRFQLDTKTYYPYIAPTTEDQLAAKNVLLNTRAAELATGFSTDPEDTAVSIVNGIFEKHADYLEKHSVVDLIRELYLNRDVSAENGEDARLLLKLLFGVVWSMMDNCRPWVNGDFVYNGTEGVPFLDASYKFQNWTPLTKSLL